MLFQSLRMRFLELEENLDALAKWRFNSPPTPTDHTDEADANTPTNATKTGEKRIGYYDGSLDWRFQPNILECYQKKAVLQRDAGVLRL